MSEQDLTSRYSAQDYDCWDLDQDSPRSGIFPFALQEPLPRYDIIYNWGLFYTLEGVQNKKDLKTIGKTLEGWTKLLMSTEHLDANFLAQEYIKESKGEDIRCLVLGRKVIASMVRTPAEGEFKSNLHAGGKSKSIKITTEERRLAVRASRTLGLNLSGVDIIRSDSGPKIIEVNSSPGLQGIQGITKLDLASKIIQYIEMYSGFVKT